MQRHPLLDLGKGKGYKMVKIGEGMFNPLTMKDTEQQV